MKTIDLKKYSGPNARRRRVLALQKRLESRYGPFKPFKKIDPVQELILTVLSQNTNDVNRDRAYRSLRERFPSWEELLEAPDGEVEEAIRVGGLAHNKTRSIKAILKEIKKSRRDFKLDHLKTLPLDEALDELTGLPGVGLKTASCVMLFSFGQPAMPVDTHVHRLSIRLGLVTGKATPDQTHHVLMSIVPESSIYPFHLYLIRHGRETCHARNPDCGGCVLREMCPSSFLQCAG
jgi:endonuclease-3